MKQQVVEIFEDWIADWYEQDNQPELREWLDSHYPETSPEVAQAVADCFENKPDAVASWEVGNDNKINVIIHPVYKHQKSLNYE